MENVIERIKQIIEERNLLLKAVLDMRFYLEHETNPNLDKLYPSTYLERINQVLNTIEEK